MWQTVLAVSSTGSSTEIVFLVVFVYVSFGGFVSGCLLRLMTCDILQLTFTVQLHCRCIICCPFYSILCYMYSNCIVLSNKYAIK